MAGLIFDESVGPDKTLEPSQVKPKVRLLEDPKQSKVGTYIQYTRTCELHFTS